MLLPNIAMWAASAIAAVWKISQLVRLPQDKDLRVVTTCAILVFIALSAQLSTGATGEPLGQLPKPLQNVILVFFFTLLILLLQSVVRPLTVRSRGLLEVVFALLATIGLVAIFSATASDARGYSYENIGASSLGVAAFYLVGNAYMVYATLRGGQLAWIAAGQTESRARLSLRVAAGGLLICCLGTHLPRAITTSGWLLLDRTLLPGTAVWTTPLLAIGIGIFFTGVGYPGARTAFIKARLWLEVRQRYWQLRPLWLALCERFPSIALFPPEKPIHEAFRLRNMRLRYYRRVIECRDGLVCLSPYVTEPIESTAPTERQAALFYDALQRSVSGAAVSSVSTIAAPQTAGMEADTQELLSLSRAIDRHRPHQDEPDLANTDQSDHGMR